MQHLALHDGRLISDFLEIRMEEPIFDLEGRTQGRRLGVVVTDLGLSTITICVADVVILGTLGLQRTGKDLTACDFLQRY